MEAVIDEVAQWALRKKSLIMAYYSPQGHWKGKAAIGKLHAATKVGETTIATWLGKQPLWQIYQSRPKKIVRPIIDISKPSDTHQCDLLHLPHDTM